MSTSISRLRSRRGQALVGVMAGAALLGVLSMALAAFSRFLSKEQRQANTLFQISQVSRLFHTTLQNPIAWQNTAADPENLMACIAQNSDCRGAGGTFRADDATSSTGAPHLLNGWAPVTYRDGQMAYRFTATGTPCSPDSSRDLSRDNSSSGEVLGQGLLGSTRTKKRDDCPFSLELTWTPQCPALPTPCVGYPILVNGHWGYDGNAGSPALVFNSKNYDFKLIANAFPQGSFVLAQADGTQSLFYNPQTGAPYVPGQFARRVQDVLGEFDGSYFRPKSSGIYQASVSAVWNPQPWNGYGCLASLMVSGTDGSGSQYGISTDYPTLSATDTCTANLSQTIFLQAGRDALWVLLNDSWPGTATIGIWSTLSIVRIR